MKERGEQIYRVLYFGRVENIQLLLRLQEWDDEICEGDELDGCFDLHSHWRSANVVSKRIRLLNQEPPTASESAKTLGSGCQNHIHGRGGQPIMPPITPFYSILAGTAFIRRGEESTNVNKWDAGRARAILFAVDKSREPGHQFRPEQN
jgi:hypothetical protein